MKVLPDESNKTIHQKQTEVSLGPNKCPFSIRVRNWKDGSSLQETLHQRAVKSQPCKSKACQNSIMMPESLMLVPKETPDHAEDILMQAIDFINQFYHSYKTPRPDVHLARIEAVAKEIDITGSYQLTVEELAFGAKQAWRNAPRCIGRIQWSNLQVLDARTCCTTKDMFHFLCKHIEFATNGGNIRSTITVFPQRGDGKHDFRIWNSQLVRYAGYQMPGGKIQGDPSNVEFTELCIQLGWKPKYGRFDVLPLVLQVNGEDPDVFEIPPELILEVPMEHPEYKWFEELQLRWYALPAVSNMLLEVGGLKFPACPFNGWYMGTEIGVRDFCDIQRYNIIEEVGRRMGLDIHKLSSLWKDQALVAINIAVMHSFQRHNVTITDHHSATESFMTHMETEYQLRGGCPADWIWLVPPMSGALTPVFHQEMVNYILSPFFYYQPDPWPTHVWRDEKKRPKKRQISFKGVARAALFCSSLWHRAVKERAPCTVLYATETGKSKTFAQQFNSMLNCAFNSRVLCMEDYNLRDLEKECLLVVIASTFGNGESPRNGQSFKSHLFATQHLRNKFRFCVFGLGSRMYPQFCAFAHAVDGKLADLGGRRVTPTGEGDELNGQEKAFQVWAEAAIKDACQEFGICGKLPLRLPEAKQLNDTWNPQEYRVQSESCAQDRITALSAIHSQAILPMKLKRRQNLQSPQSSRSTILVELEREEGAEDVRFLPGEHVGVFPGNPTQLVTGILKHVPNAPPINQSLRLERFSDTTHATDKGWHKDSRIPTCPLSQALTYYLDVTTPPSQSLLGKLSQLAGQECDRQRLLTLAQDLKEYSTWTTFRRPTFLEVLEEFSSLKLPETFLLSQLPPLKPRLYSISSSPDLHPGELHLTVAVVSYRSQDGEGPLHHGVCSTWLNTIKEGDTVPCFIHSSSGFHLPAEPSAPAILVGVGSGIAPFRGFWQQRLHDMKKTGVAGMPMTLVFGCRSSDEDHLYREETLEMKREGVLKSISAAHSRQPGQPKVYVQDVLRERLSGEVLRVLHQDKGHFYVCGDLSMATNVSDAVQEILVQQLGMNSKQAADCLTQLRAEKRYHEDIFGTVFQTSDAKEALTEKRVEA